MKSGVKADSKPEEADFDRISCPTAIYSVFFFAWRFDSRPDSIFWSLNGQVTGLRGQVGGFRGLIWCMKSRFKT